VHDLTDFKAYAGRNGTLSRVRNRLWQTGLNRSDVVIAISEATRHDLAATLGISGSRVRVVYEGVDQERFTPGGPGVATAPPFLLYVGTLDAHKNVPFLLRIHAELVARGLDVELVLAGRHPRERVAALADALPEAVRERVRWAGFVDDAELVRLLRSCAAFVFPSLNEGFGLAVVEAMACGAPVVSSGAGSLEEVVGAGGLVLPPTDEGQWVGALERVLGDPSYREALVARAVTRAEAFSWDRAAASYRECLGGSAPRYRPPASLSHRVAQERVREQ